MLLIGRKVKKMIELYLKKIALKIDMEEEDDCKIDEEIVSQAEENINLNLIRLLQSSTLL